ncbi:LamG-like jellyroll fold domain-containing protein [Cohnella suwonensis]|uniref:LamG-like jellyroll fold domain-containing protein n=1 Tax=Cohnella suwonensis TaxID=696072 RepID=A0ABW0LY98_9BACL
MRKILMVLLCVAVLGAIPFAGSPKAIEAAAATDASVIDIFGREVNANGIDLVDWQGYLANPYVKLTVKPPTSAVYPVTITVNAQGSSRLMMDLPSTLSANGASKTLTFSSSSVQKNFLLEIAPDTTGGPGEIENYTLSMTIAENNGSSHTQTIPIRVLDQDDNVTTSFPLVFDYRFDTVNHYFDNAAYRTATERAIKDWFYFLDIQPFDTVPAGAETNFVPNDNFNGNTTVTNNAAYTGEWIFLRGLNDPYSTGWNSNNGQYHKRNGVQVPGPLYRSLGAALDFNAGATPFASMNDNDWYLTDLNQVTDVYGLMMHEFGHGFAYSDSWSGMANYVNTSGVNDAEVIAYQGRSVPLDGSYHIPGDQIYWDRLSGQSAGWTSLFPTRRWMLTKLTLLVAENAGWTLNKNLTPFLAPSIVTVSLPNGTKGQSYSQQLTAKGGVPFYDWTVSGGTLPPGLSLNRFTGAISGTISSSAPQNSYTFTIQLRDYDEMSAPVTKSFTISLGTGGGGGDLVANYLFNETSGTSAADATGNGWTGTLNGGAAWAAGQAGNALSLNGTSAYASLPTGIVNTLNDFSVSTWVKVNSSTDWSRIFDFGTGTTTHMFLTPKAGSSGGLRFAITTGGSGGEQQLNAPALTTGVWKHIAVTLSGTTGKLYVDGVEVATNSGMTLKPSSLGSTNQNYIGKSQYSDPYLNGSVDDFRIYNRTLTAAEVSAIAGPPPSGFVANYLFNETSGTTAADSSGNGKTATLNGTAAWAAGKSGNGLSLSGTSAYASLPTGIVGALNDFTVATWVKVNSSADWARIFDFGTGTTSYMFLTPKAGGSGLRFAISTGGSGAEQQLNAAALTTGVWKHVAITLSGTTGKLYVDGVEAASNSSMTLKPSSLGNTNLNYIGKSQYADPNLNGVIDDFRIYNRALSASEIAALAL